MMGFEPAIQASEQPQTHTLNHMAARTGFIVTNI